MAFRRCLQSLFPIIAPSLRILAAARPLRPLSSSAPSLSSASDRWSHSQTSRHFSSITDGGDSDDDDDDDDEEDYEEGDWETSDGEIEVVSRPSKVTHKRYTPEMKVAAAAEIGYTVLGPIEKGVRVCKPYVPVFAIIQIGSQQFKVSNDDCIFIEKLKFCDVNDKIILNKILLLGSSEETIVGRPLVPEAAVHAIVEEHALDAKVLIFKKKRRKNYRRCNGHRQELTKIRITDIQGIVKPKIVHTPKPPNPPSPPMTQKKRSKRGKKKEKVAVAA